MRILSFLVAMVALLAGNPGPVEAHSRSFFVFGVHLPLYYPPPVYTYPPPPVVYYPAPAVAVPGDCRPVTGRGETTGTIYEGIACRQPDGSWRVTPR